jgi:hypothetical protein
MVSILKRKVLAAHAHETAPAGPRDTVERTDYNEPIALAKQRVAIVERVMKLPYIKATRDTERGEERFVARDDLIKAIHDYATVSRAAALAPAPAAPTTPTLHRCPYCNIDLRRDDEMGTVDKYQNVCHKACLANARRTPEARKESK